MKNIKVLKREAKEGNADAQYELAQRYEKGIGVRRNVRLCVKWYTEAGLQKHPGAVFRFAMILLNNDDMDGIGFLEGAAELGHIEAQYELGHRYYLGDGVEQSIEKASYWLKKAASRGHIEAQVVLGCLYNVDVGDRKKAAYWFKKAAEQGHVEAQVVLGYLYDIDGDRKKAAYWLDKAAKQGGGRAANELEMLRREL